MLNRKSPLSLYVAGLIVLPAKVSVVIFCFLMYLQIYSDSSCVGYVPNTSTATAQTPGTFDSNAVSS